MRSPWAARDQRKEGEREIRKDWKRERQRERKKREREGGYIIEKICKVV